MPATPVIVVGAGATGAYLAALLSQSPALDVTVVARGETLETIREHGIVARMGDQVITAHPRVIAPEEAVPCSGFVLLCVKAYDNVAALATVERLVGPDATFVNLQNGMRQDAEVAAVVGGERCLASALYVASERIAPGRVVAQNRPRIVVGPLIGRDLQRAVQLRDLLITADIDCEVDVEVAARRWEKWALNCALNPITALTAKRSDEIWAQPNARRLFEGVVDEALDTARAAGATVADGARARVLGTAAGLICHSSMAEDLRAGRPLERAEFTGEVLRLAGEASRVPLTAALDALLELMDPGPPSTQDGSVRERPRTAMVGDSDGGQ